MALFAVRHRPHRPRRSASAALALAIGVGSVLAAVVATAPTANAADETLSHVASASSGGNRTNHTVRIPASVQPGDALVLFLTWNSTKAVATAPAGWTQVETRTGQRHQWSRLDQGRR